MENSTQLDKITGKVRLTKKVKFKPNQSLKAKARSSNPLNTKRVNVIIEPTDDEEGSYTIPAYTFLKSNSRSVHVGLRNMSCHAVTLSKGTVKELGSRKQRTRVCKLNKLTTEID